MTDIITSRRVWLDDAIDAEKSKVNPDWNKISKLSNAPASIPLNLLDMEVLDARNAEIYIENILK